MVIRYRQLQAPTLLDDVEDDGSASAAQSMAQAFKAFEQESLGIVSDLRAEQGQREGAAAGASGEPDFREGARRMTAYGQAYNNAALRSYAIKAEADAEDQAARLETEAANDPDHFRLTFGAVRDAHIKNAPPMARQVLSELYDRRLADGVSRLSRALAVDFRNQARADTAEGIQRQTDRVANLMSEDNPANEARIAEEQAKLTALIDGAMNDGTYSKVEAQAAHIDAQRAITQQTVVARFRKVLDNPYGDPVKFISRLKEENKKSDVLSPEEEQKLEAALFAELREKNMLEAEARQRANAEEQARYEAGDREATARLLDRTLTQKWLHDRVESGDLKPERATALLGHLTNGDSGKSDPEELYRVETNLLGYTDEEIETAYGISWEDKRRLTLKKHEWESGWRGTQEGREAADRIDRALGITPGIMSQLLPEAERKARERALTDWYTTVDALEPAERQPQAIAKAEEVIDRVIRSNTSLKLETLRRNRAALAAEIAKGEQSKYEKKVAEQDLATFDTQIRALEQKVK